MGSPAGLLIGPRLDVVPDICDVIKQAGATASARIAVEAMDGAWTYRELLERTQRLAAALAGRGVGPGMLVGISLGRGRDLLAALLAILEAGAAFVPIDCSHPRARLEASDR